MTKVPQIWIGYLIVDKDGYECDEEAVCQVVGDDLRSVTGVEVLTFSFIKLWDSNVLATTRCSGECFG